MGQSLDHLFDRNVAWADRKTRDDPHFFRRLAEQQAPRYLWIGCSDSRITANDVLGLDPGEVFVHRNIANVVHTSDMNVLAVLEFAVEYLKVEHVIVCGHYGCGGVRRALDVDRGAWLGDWLQPIAMLVHKHRGVFASLQGSDKINRVCEVNVEMQVRRLAATPIIENAWARGQTLSLHGWIYAIDDGLLRDLGPLLTSIQERDALPSIDDRIHNPIEPVSAMRRQAFAAFSPGPETADAICCEPLGASPCVQALPR